MADDVDGEKLEQVYRAIQDTLANLQALNQELFGLRIPTQMDGDRLASVEEGLQDLRRICLLTSQRVGRLDEKVEKLEETMRKLGGRP